jgi:hypothetical protein
MYGYHHGYPHTGAFRPSAHSNVYGTAEQVAIDTTRVAVAGGGTAAATAASLAVAAGGVAAIPVAGWVAAAGLGTAAGVVALVGAIKGGKARKRDAVALAKKLKLPEPEKAPGFIVGALKMSKAKRARLIARYKRRIARISKRRNKLFAKARARRLAKLRWRLRVLEALAKIENPKRMTAAERKAAALVKRQRTLPPSEAVNEANSPTIDPEVEDSIEVKAEAIEEKSDPAVGEAPLTAEGTAAAPSGLAAVPAWGWALGAVAVIGGILVVTRGKDKKAH